MASYEELQALAAARTTASQEKLAAERAKGESLERERKLALENKARQDIQKERDLLVAREQKRKRDEEQRKQIEMQKKRQLEQRERERKEREKYGMDVVKFRNATEKAITNAGGSAKLQKKIKARERDHQDSVSPPPNLREYSTLTREEKRRKKEAAMLGLVTSGKRKAHSSSSNHHQQPKKVEPTSGRLMPLGTHKRDTRTVDQIERDLEATRRAKAAVQGRDGQRSRLLEEEKRERELESMLRRSKAMQEKRSMDEGRSKSMTRSDSDNSDGKQRQKASNGSSRVEEHSAIMSKPKIKNPELSRGFNPADYLPGAPIKASLLPKATQKPFQAVEHIKGQRDVGRAVAEQIGPPKKETPREKFLREEAERKKQLEKQRGVKRLREDADDSNDEEVNESEEDEEESEEYESEEYESEEDQEDQRHPSSKKEELKNEIWSIFNRRDKSEYLARDLDSDDDMEVDMESLRREEERSARIARLEDKREEEALQKREREKAQRKAAKGRH